MFQNKIIILGNNHHNTLGLIRSFGEVGYYPYLILYGGNSNSFVARSKYIKETYFVSCVEEGLNLLINKFGNEALKPFLFFPNDKVAELVEYSFAELSNYFFVQHAYSKEGLIPYFSKSYLCTKAVEWGFDVPKTLVFYKLSIDYGQLFFPCITKPVTSVRGSKADVFVCQSIDDIKKAVELFSDSCNQIVIQEYIKKEYEVSILGVALKNEVIIPGMIHKLREYPASRGSSSFACLEEIPDNLPIDKIKKAIKEIGYVGLFSVEFVKKSDKYYFLEINFRNDGNGYVITSAGLNEPMLFCLDQLNQSYEIQNIQTPHYFMSKTDVEHIRNGQITLFRWFSDYLKTDCFLQYNKYDSAPTGNWRSYMVIEAIKAEIKRLLRK